MPFSETCQTLSRPWRVLRPRPARSITRRGLVTGWPVTLKPRVSAVRDIGPSSQRRATRPRRVSSPSAANRRAEPSGGAAVTCGAGGCELPCPGKVLLEHAHHDHPASLVGCERFRPALQRDAIEAGL